MKVEIKEIETVPPPDIRFWRTSGPHGYMSNFYRSPVFLDGEEWPTSEHYYQAQKFESRETKEMIRACATPKEAAEMGRRSDLGMRPDWDELKLRVMGTVVMAKFCQHPDLQKKLLATGEATLIEDSPYDYYWGCGKDGTGRNMLGVVLMTTRFVLKEDVNYVFKG